MAEQASFIDRLSARFAGAKVIVVEPRGEVTLEVPAAEWHATALALRDEFGFEQAVDLCGVDYLGYGSDEWDTADVSSQGFSRGVEGKAQGRFAWGEFPSEESADGARPQHMPTQRFAVVAQLRSEHGAQASLGSHDRDNLDLLRLLLQQVQQQQRPDPVPAALLDRHETGGEQLGPVAAGRGGRAFRNDSSRRSRP